MSAGAPKAPITYEGEYDDTRTYLPRQLVTVTDGAVRVGYLSTATSQGLDPPANPGQWLPFGAESDGDLLGWQQLRVAMPTATSNGTPVAGTAVDGFDLRGEPGIDADGGSGDITYCDDSLPSLYLVVINLVVTPTTNAVSTDVHQVALNDSVADYTNNTIIGTGDNRVTFTGMARLAAPVTFAPEVTIKCTGGTNRSYTLGYARYQIARFRIPLV